jgi:hypothetical protein
MSSPGGIGERVGQCPVHLRDPVVDRRGRQVRANRKVAAHFVEDLARPMHADSSHGGQRQKDIGVLDRVQDVRVEDRNPSWHARGRQS